MYLVGGATAVIEGWRPSTVDGDLRIEPDEELLAELERGLAQDLADVDAMVRGGAVDPSELGALLAEIEPELRRFPAVEPDALRAAVRELLSRFPATE